MRCLIVCVLLSVAFAQTTHDTQAAVHQFQQQVKHTVGELFKSADQNGNGEFDRADISSLLTEYDGDHDKSVSEKEFTTRFTHNAADLDMVAKGLFLELDMNRDGSVTSTDLDLYYRKIDKNHDGHVSKSEFSDYFTELFTILYVLQMQQQAAGASAAPHATH